ncbi:MAG TPA: serine protease [Candidatus Sulfotelmatobacter sp.]|jgi:S1-C subfamily serine protease|nr:serine protease [Candidatus Sulfotelmatobacter sp.]
MRRSLLACPLACLMGFAAALSPASGQEGAPSSSPSPGLVYNVDGAVYKNRDEAFAALKGSFDREVTQLPKAEAHLPAKLLAIVPTPGLLERLLGAAEPRPELASAQALQLELIARSNIDAIIQEQLFDAVSVQVSDTPKTVPNAGFDYVLSFQQMEDGKHLGWRLFKTASPQIIAGMSNDGGPTPQRLRAFVTHVAKTADNLNNVISHPGQLPGQLPGQAHPVVTGTLFFINGAGLGLTNAHVANGCQSLKVALPDGEAPANLVEADASNDLALVKVPGRQGPFARFRAASPLRQGEDVVVYGFPLAGALSTQGNLTTGIVSALTGLKDDSRFLQITAPVQPGNSGGPLLDQSGRLVGVVVSKLNAMMVASSTGDMPQNVNFAIKSQIVSNFLETNGVAYEAQPPKGKLSTADVGDLAKSFTVMIKCQK